MPMRSVDKYVYPGTSILINKFDCHNAEILRKIEILSTGGNLAYLQLHPVEGKFDFQHLKDIHYFIFQDLFDWAGQIREIDIGKGNLFCRARFINDYAETVFADFFSSCYKYRNNRKRYIEIFSSHYADLNALHPFREGNGRTQREFARELCLKCGYVFDLTQTTHNEMLSASIKSFNHGDNSEFISIFDNCIIPIEEYKDYQSKLTTELLILSKDDLN